MRSRASFLTAICEKNDSNARSNTMGLIVFLVILVLLFGGGGFYFGPPLRISLMVSNDFRRS